MPVGPRGSEERRGLSLAFTASLPESQQRVRLAIHVLADSSPFPPGERRAKQRTTSRFQSLPDRTVPMGTPRTPTDWPIAIVRDCQQHAFSAP
jgi:hypothetical protein